MRDQRRTQLKQKYGEDNVEFSESEESSIDETESKSAMKNKSNVEQESYDFDREISEESENSQSMMTEEEDIEQQKAIKEDFNPVLFLGRFLKQINDDYKAAVERGEKFDLEAYNWEEYAFMAFPSKIWVKDKIES